MKECGDAKKLIKLVLPLVLVYMAALVIVLVLKVSLFFTFQVMVWIYISFAGLWKFGGGEGYELMALLPLRRKTKWNVLFGIMALELVALCAIFMCFNAKDGFWPAGSLAMWSAAEVLYLAGGVVLVKKDRFLKYIRYVMHPMIFVIVAVSGQDPIGIRLGIARDGAVHVLVFVVTAIMLAANVVHLWFVRRRYVGRRG